MGNYKRLVLCTIVSKALGKVNNRSIIVPANRAQSWMEKYFNSDTDKYGVISTLTRKGKDYYEDKRLIICEMANRKLVWKKYMK